MIIDYQKKLLCFLKCWGQLLFLLYLVEVCWLAWRKNQWQDHPSECTQFSIQTYNHILPWLFGAQVNSIALDWFFPARLNYSLNAPIDAALRGETGVDDMRNFSVLWRVKNRMRTSMAEWRQSNLMRSVERNLLRDDCKTHVLWWCHWLICYQEIGGLNSFIRRGYTNIVY